MSTRRAAAAFCAAAALLATGCGNDDSTSADDGTSVEGITKEEFIAQADEICSEGGEEIAAGADRILGTGPGATDAQFARFVDEVAIPSTNEQIAAVDALPVPEGDEEEIDAFLESAREEAEALSADPASLKDGNPFAATNELGEAYGFEVCAK